MLVITPQTALSHFGRKALQESSDTAVDTVGMFRHCTHYNTMVSHIDQLEHKLASAIMTAFNSSGPAHISVPLDVLRSPVTFAAPSYNLSSLLARPAWKDESAIDAFESCPEVARVFAPDLIRNYVMTKRQELRYMEDISDEEKIEIYIDTV